jgi:hypothetical protein
MLSSSRKRCNDAGMSEIQYVNAVQIAQENLEEAVRQWTHATADFNAGKIPQSRLDQLQELKDIATTDLARVMREN